MGCQLVENTAFYSHGIKQINWVVFMYKVLSHRQNIGLRLLKGDMITSLLKDCYTTNLPTRAGQAYLFYVLEKSNTLASHQNHCSEVADCM